MYYANKIHRQLECILNQIFYEKQIVSIMYLFGCQEISTETWKQFDISIDSNVAMRFLDIHPRTFFRYISTKAERL